jgi:electron transport complex protein RnfD
MSTSGPGLLLTTSPFLKQREDTAYIMWQVNLSLAPVVAAAVYYFGVQVLLILGAATAGAVGVEWMYSRSGGLERSSIRDGSAVITGLLLGLTLPPGLPVWMALVGGGVAMGLGKVLFGGIGFNIFNPALVGRAFLQAAFPEAMTTWSRQPAPEAWFAVDPKVLALPLSSSGIDAVSTATPLARMKFEAQFAEVPDLLLGSTTGSIGETAALVILVCGVYMAAKRVLNWRIPLSIFLATAVVATALHLADPVTHPTALFHLFSGGLMLGAVFMATDPVTSPITQRGCWVFGAGVGVLVVVIRTYGGLPEGVMYAILLMNAATPLVNRVTRARVYGTGRSARVAGS